MRQALNAFIAMTCLFIVTVNFAPAQVGNPASVGFRNRTEVNVIVKGYTIVNGGQRPGPILQLKKTDGKAFETAVPNGIRYYTIHDANNPARVLLRDHPVPIQGRDVVLDIVPVPGQPNRVMLVPATAP